MKYLITESQFDKLIFKYLDNQDFVKVDTSHGFDLLNSVDDDVVRIYYEYSSRTCTISHFLIREIRTFFSLGLGVSAAVIIGKWVENKFGVVVDEVDADHIFRDT